MQRNSIHTVREKVTRRENCTVGITTQNTRLRNFAPGDIPTTIKVSVERIYNSWDYQAHYTCIDENIIQMWVCPDFFKRRNLIGYVGILSQYAYSV